MCAVVVVVRFLASLWASARVSFLLLAVYNVWKLKLFIIIFLNIQSTNTEKRKKRNFIANLFNNLNTKVKYCIIEYDTIYLSIS